MFKQLVIGLSLVLLSGCETQHLEQYHQQTLDVIKQSQQQSDERFNENDRQMQQQKDQIASLQGQLARIEHSLHELAELAEKKLTLPEKKKPKSRSSKASITEIPTNQILLGEVERVTIDSVHQSFDARVDTGAATSSLNAINIEEFERNGKDWVRFQLDEGQGAKETSQWIEAKVVRYVRIRQASNDDTERRAVVDLWVKLGTIHEKAEFTLADRSMMTNPILLGREFIRDIAIVDVSRSYLQSKKP